MVFSGVPSELPSLKPSEGPTSGTLKCRWKLITLMIYYGLEVFYPVIGNLPDWDKYSTYISNQITGKLWQPAATL